jgi:hypothetical protein
MLVNIDNISIIPDNNNNKNNNDDSLSPVINGGVGYFNMIYDIRLLQTHFNNISTVLNGGVLYLSSIDIIATISTSNFTLCKSTGRGGFFFFYDKLKLFYFN